MKLLIALGLTVLMIAPAAYADRSRAGWWLGTFGKAEVSSNWNGWMETQVRNGLNNGRVDQLLYRTGLLYTTDGGHEVGSLVGFIQTGSSLERRYTLQHGMTYAQGDVSKLSAASGMAGFCRESGRRSSFSLFASLFA